MAFMQTMGERIRERRERLGLSRPQLAEKLGVTPQLVGQWECGKVQNIRPHNLLKMCELFQVSQKYLIRGSILEKAKTIPLRVLGKHSEPTGHFIARHWEEFKPETRYVLYRIARSDLGEVLERRDPDKSDIPNPDRRKNNPM